MHAIASLKVLLDATKPQDGVNGNAGGIHNEEGAANGSEVVQAKVFFICYLTTSA